MALSGQAKTDYQREYMRKRRSNKGLTEKPKGLTGTFTIDQKFVDSIPAVIEKADREGKAEMDYLLKTPLAQLEKEKIWIPNWRRAMG